MSFAKKSILPVFILFLCAAGNVDHGSGGIADDAVKPGGDYDVLDHTIKTLMEQYKVPALSLEITDADGTLWSMGYGKSTKTTVGRISGDTVYRVGSVSKLFTDIALMQLVEEGKIKLKDPVVKYIPSFAPKSRFPLEEMTVEMLLNHSSGLVREPPVGNYFDSRTHTLRDVVASLNETQLVYRPGSQVQYSNAAISVVGYIVEVMRDRSFSAVIDDCILKPAGMADSSFKPLPGLVNRMPNGEMRRYHAANFDAPTFELGIAPAGNLYSTMSDMGHFMRALLKGGRGKYGLILDKATLEKMWQPAQYKSARAHQFGLGFILSDFDQELAVSHGGALYGFSTQMMVLPKSQIGVSVSANLDFANGLVDRIADYALRYVKAVKAGRVVPSFVHSRPIDQKTIKALIGVYKSQDGDTVHLIQKGNDIYLDRAAGHSLRLMQRTDKIIIDDLVFSLDTVEITPNQLVLGSDTYQRVADVRPLPAQAEIAPYIGEYGEDHNILYIYEKNGTLYALIEWMAAYPLKKIGAGQYQFPDFGLYPEEVLSFKASINGAVSAVHLGALPFHRRDDKGISGGTFKIKPQRPVPALIQEAINANPPQEKGDFHQSDLVDITNYADTIKTDIRYATNNNFLGTPVYSLPKAFMQRKAAEALGRISARLEKMGYGLLVHDAYRPWYVTKVFWDATPLDKKIFVANPKDASRHNRGSAVDLTLYDLKTGALIEMPGVYDEMTERSYIHYPGGTSSQRWHRDMLIREMTREGFTVYDYEWWHFDFQGWEHYPIGNQTFEQIEMKK